MFDKIFKYLVIILLISILILGYAAFNEVQGLLQAITEFQDAMYFEQSTEHMAIEDKLDRLLEILIADPGTKLKF